MTSFRFINNIWPEFAKLLAARPIVIQKLHLSEMDSLNETFSLNLQCYVVNRLYIHVFHRLRYIRVYLNIYVAYLRSRYKKPICREG